MSLLLDISEDYSINNVDVYRRFTNIIEYLEYKDFDEDLEDMIGSTSPGGYGEPYFVFLLVDKHLNKLAEDTGVIFDYDASHVVKVNFLDMLINIRDISKEDLENLIAIFENNDCEEVLTSLYAKTYGNDGLILLDGIYKIKDYFPLTLMKTLESTLKSVVNDVEDVDDYINENKPVLEFLTQMYDKDQPVENTVINYISNSDNVDHYLISENIKAQSNVLFNSAIDKDTTAINIVITIFISTDFNGDVYGEYITYFENLISTDVVEEINLLVISIANAIRNFNKTLS